MVWWLHRFIDGEDAFPVAALFLWKGREGAKETHRIAATAQPVWLVRAAAISLLIFSLAGLQLNSPVSPPLTVWIDDSPSMFTVENGVTRIRTALEAVELQLSAYAFSSVTFRSLADPGQTWTVRHSDSSGWEGELRAWLGAARGEPQFPIPQLMNKESLHWLVSDGVSAGIADWVRTAPVSNLIEVGGLGENVGLLGFSMRRIAGESAGAQLMVTLMNGGTQEAKRELVIFAGDDQIVNIPVTLSPGEREHRVFGVTQLPLVQLRASAIPSDALVVDDSLTLSAESVQPVLVTIGEDCGEHLHAALAAIPSLEISSASVDSGLRVSCGAKDAALKGPALRVAGAGSFLRATEDLFWHGSSGRLRDLSLNPQWLVMRSLGETVSGQVLLSAGNQPLILFDREGGVIDVGLDMGASALARLPEYPLLVSGLVDLLLPARSVMGEPIEVTNASPVAILPQPMELNPSQSQFSIRQSARNASELLTSVVLFLLILEMVLLLWRRVINSRKLATRVKIS